jgi:hypothetical protein
VQEAQQIASFLKQNEGSSTAAEHPGASAAAAALGLSLGPLLHFFILFFLRLSTPHARTHTHTRSVGTCFKNEEKKSADAEFANTKYVYRVSVVKNQ